MTPSDLELVRAFLASRDEATFVTLYDRHTPRMWGLASRLCAGEGSDASEVVQEAWARAVDRLHTFRGDGALSSWLCGICVNVWRETLRRRHPEVALDEGQADPVSLSAHPAEVVDVRRALADLAPGYRAVVVLYGIYGFSHAEIADRLGISEGTSKSQLSRARAALRAATGVARPADPDASPP